MAPSYTPNKIPGMALPSSLLKYEEPQQLQDIMHMQALQRAQEIKNQNDQAIAAANEQKLELGNQARESFKSRFAESNGEADTLGVLERVLAEQGDMAGLLDLERIKESRAQKAEVLSEADRQFLEDNGLEVPQGVSRRVFGTASNMFNTGVLTPGGVSQGEPPTDGGDVLTNFDINRIPPKQRSSAIKEMGYIQDLNKSKQILSEVYDNIAEMDFIQENMPFTATSAESSSQRSSILGAVQAGWKGPMSDAEQRKMKGLIPSSYDTKEQVLAKKEALLAMLENNSKPTPTLDYYNPGIRKPRDYEQRADPLGRANEIVAGQQNAAPFQVPNAQFQGVDQATGLPIFKRGR